MVSKRKLTLSALASAMLALVFAVGTAGAHVTVEPRESAPGAYQRYAVRVPTEKGVPTIKVRLEFPADVTVSSFQPKPGWKREVERDGQQRIVAVTWSGGQIGPGEFDEFGFVARNPRQPATMSWKAYQTYEGGEIVEWVGPSGADRPASVTEVRAAGAAAAQPSAVVVAASAPIEEHETPVSANSGSDLPLFVALAALVLALVALILAIVVLLRRPVQHPA